MKALFALLILASVVSAAEPPTWHKRVMAAQQLEAVERALVDVRREIVAQTGSSSDSRALIAAVERLKILEATRDHLKRFRHEHSLAGRMEKEKAAR